MLKKEVCENCIYFCVEHESQIGACILYNIRKERSTCCPQFKAKKPITNGIIVTKTSTEYVIHNSEFFVTVKVIIKDGETQLTICPKDGDGRFCFKNSKPETVKAVAELMIAAVALVEDKQ